MMTCFDWQHHFDQQRQQAFNAAAMMPVDRLAAVATEIDRLVATGASFDIAKKSLRILTAALPKTLVIGV